jgi:type IV secretion system protein VirB9
MIRLVVVFILLVQTSAYADELLNKFFLKKEHSSFTDQEKKSLNLLEKLKRRQSLAPVKGEDGSIQFLFGSQQPILICAPFKVCDLLLEEGEKIQSFPQIGDPRWKVTSIQSGLGSKMREHIILKPIDIDLTTNLIIPTDRRTYHIELKSDKIEYMPQVSFLYPEENDNSKLLEFHQEAKEEDVDSFVNLSFNYEISGKASWKPVRVYNNGRQTIIQMPELFEKREAPVLLILRTPGTFFKSPELDLVQYRIKKDLYIVDSLFERAILLAGVGKNQQQVIITKSS